MSLHRRRKPSHPLFILHAFPVHLAVPEAILDSAVLQSPERRAWRGKPYRYAGPGALRAVYTFGVLRGAYRIVRWRRAGEKRPCFDGLPATDLNVVGKSIARIKAAQGASNPVRLFLEGIPAPESGAG